MHTSPTPPPYTQAEWQHINRLGLLVEEHLQQLDVGLTMGGEPTFVSSDDFESLQWRLEALGEDKRLIAAKLLQRLADRFAGANGILHYAIGKAYAEEPLPRWALSCYWRKDGVPIWNNPALQAQDGADYGATQATAYTFIQTLARYLGVNPGCILPAYNRDTDPPAGYVLPLVAVLKAEKLRWSTGLGNLLL